MREELINQAVLKFVEDAKRVYGDHLDQIILFGSCARGDADSESDIDIMVLLDIPEEEAQNERGRIVEISNRIDSEFGYDILMSPVVQSKKVFMKYKNVMPFYINVQKEGIVYA